MKLLKKSKSWKITVCNVKQGRTEYSRTQEPEEDRGGYEVIGHVFSSHVGESLPEYAEALPEFGREVRVARENPRPRKLDGSPQILLLLVKRCDGGNFEWIDFAVTTLDGASDNRAKSFLKVAIARQLQISLHGFGRQTVASEGQPLVICEN